MEQKMTLIGSWHPGKHCRNHLLQKNNPYLVPALNRGLHGPACVCSHLFQHGCQDMGGQEEIRYTEPLGSHQKSQGPLKVLWNCNRLDREGMPYVDVFGCGHGHEHWESHIKHQFEQTEQWRKKFKEPKIETRKRIEDMLPTSCLYVLYIYSLSI